MTLKEMALRLLQKATRPLSIRDPAHWRNHSDDVPSGERVTPESVLSLSAAWACVNLLVGTQASLPLMVYRSAREGTKLVADDHPLYRTLHDSPNSLQTALDFWEFMCASLELWGNAYARIVRISGRVVSLIPILPQSMSVGYIAGSRLEYRWTDDGRHHVATSDDVLHIRGFGGNPLGGMSTLAFGARAFGLGIAVDRAAGSTFKNGLRPSVSIGFKEWLTKEQRDVVEQRLAEKYAGAVNAGRPFIREGGQTLDVISLKPEDAQMLESRGFGIEEVARFFGVPPFMIGHTEKVSSWGTGLEQQILAFQKFTLRRRLKRIESACEKQLLTAADRSEGLSIEFNIEGLLRADSAGRASFYREMSQIGAMTINEIRAKENLPPVPGGDVPRMQSQNIPIQQDPQKALPAA